MKWIIFDLDGTLADIEDRRQLCTKENGKMDWNKFFDPVHGAELNGKPRKDPFKSGNFVNKINYLT